MRRIAIALITAALAGAATAGDFEGRAEYQITDPRGQHGTALALVGPGGARFHVEFSGPSFAKAGVPVVKATTLVRASERGRVYAIDDNNRSYAVLEAGASRDRGWKVTKLGSSWRGMRASEPASSRRTRGRRRSASRPRWGASRSGRR